MFQRGSERLYSTCNVKLLMLFYFNKSPSLSTNIIFYFYTITWNHSPLSEWWSWLPTVRYHGSEAMPGWLYTSRHVLAKCSSVGEVTCHWWT